MSKGKGLKYVSLTTLFLAIVMLLSIAIGSYAVTPKLIYLNGEAWVPSTTVLSRINTIKARPLDGMVINSTSESLLNQGNTLTHVQMETNFGSLSQSSFSGGTLTDNFLYLDNSYRPGDLFNDTAWAAGVARVGYFALMCAEKGFKGLFLDTETYDRASYGYYSCFQWCNNSAHTSAVNGHTYAYRTNQTAGKTGEQYAAQARLRGQQVMTAIKNNFPNAVVIVTFGPSHYGNYMDWSSPTPDPLTDERALSYKMQGAYFMGLLDTKGTGNTIVDGNELYSNETWDKYDQDAYWLPKYVHQSAWYNAFASLTFASSFPETYKQACSVDDCLSDHVTPQTATNTQNELTWALRRCDNYTWYYSQAYDWTITSGTAPAPPPSDIVTAVANAKATAATSAPGYQWYFNTYETDTVGQNAAWWNIQSGTWTVVTAPRGGISTNKAYSSYNGTTILNGNENPGSGGTWTNYDVSAWMYMTTNVNYKGILARVKDSNNYYALVIYAGAPRIYKIVGGTWTGLLYGSYTWNINTWYNVKFSLNGRTLTASISTDGTNYTTVGSVTDTTYTSGIIGLKTWNSTTHFDDVKVIAK